MQRINSLEKTLMLRKIEGKKEKEVAEDEIISIMDSMGMNLSKLWETVEDRGAWHTTVHRVTNSWT